MLGNPGLVLLNVMSALCMTRVQKCRYSSVWFITVCVSGFTGFTHTIQSTASMRDRSLVGRPMASRMMAMVMMPPAGMPAAPTLEAVAVTLEIMMKLSYE